MAIQRDRIERISDRIQKVQLELDAIRTDLLSVLGESVFAPPAHLIRPLKLWKKIRDVGDTVTQDQLHVLAKNLGYDLRGLGGFFAGPNSSLVKLSNERIGLREWASKEVEKYKEWLESH